MQPAGHTQFYTTLTDATLQRELPLFLTRERDHALLQPLLDRLKTQDRAKEEPK